MQAPVRRNTIVLEIALPTTQVPSLQKMEKNSSEKQPTADSFFEAMKLAILRHSIR